MSYVTVRVPATTANLGPGFDCLGLALNLWGVIRLEVADQPLPPSRDPVACLVAEAACCLWEQLGTPAPPGLVVRYDGEVPVARGLGASAIARVGGLMAANALSGYPLDAEAILQLAARLEGHADNAAPAIFGGLQVVARRDDGIFIHMSIELPPNLRVAIFVPHQELATAQAREALPISFSREDAVYNLSRAALLVASLATGRLDYLREATLDRIHQPYRARLFPPMSSLLKAALGAGALGAFLSGAGPSVAAFALAEEAEEIAKAMQTLAQRLGLYGEALVCSPTLQGAHVVEEG